MRQNGEMMRSTAMTGWPEKGCAFTAAQLWYWVSAELGDALAGAQPDDLAGETSPTCPRCGSGDTRKRGYDPSGRRRFQCDSCGRSFTARTGSVMAFSKIPEGAWAKFIECQMASMDLASTARACGVGVPTARKMLHRVVRVLYEHAAAGLEPAPEALDDLSRALSDVSAAVRAFSPLAAGESAAGWGGFQEVMRFTVRKDVGGVARLRAFWPAPGAASADGVPGSPEKGSADAARALIERALAWTGMGALWDGVPFDLDACAVHPLARMDAIREEARQLAQGIVGRAIERTAPGEMRMFTVRLGAFGFRWGGGAGDAPAEVRKVAPALSA